MKKTKEISLDGNSLVKEDNYIIDTCTIFNLLKIDHEEQLLKILFSNGIFIEEKIYNK